IPKILSRREVFSCKFDFGLFGESADAVRGGAVWPRSGPTALDIAVARLGPRRRDPQDNHSTGLLRLGKGRSYELAVAGGIRIAADGLRKNLSGRHFWQFVADCCGLLGVRDDPNVLCRNKRRETGNCFGCHRPCADDIENLFWRAGPAARPETRSAPSSEQHGTSRKRPFHAESCQFALSSVSASPNLFCLCLAPQNNDRNSSNRRARTSSAEKYMTRGLADKFQEPPEKATLARGRIRRPLPSKRCGRCL